MTKIRAEELTSGTVFHFTDGGIPFVARNETELSSDELDGILTFGELVSVIEWMNPELDVYVEETEE